MFLRFLYGVFTVSLRSATVMYGLAQDIYVSMTILIGVYYGYATISYGWATVMLRFRTMSPRLSTISLRLLYDYATFSPRLSRMCHDLMEVCNQGLTQNLLLGLFILLISRPTIAKSCSAISWCRSITSWTINLRRLIWIAMVVLFFYLMWADDEPGTEWAPALTEWALFLYTHHWMILVKRSETYWKHS